MRPDLSILAFPASWGGDYNYNEAVKALFGDHHGIDRDLAFSPQFSTLSEDQIEQLSAHPGLPANIAKFIEGSDGRRRQVGARGQPDATAAPDSGVVRVAGRCGPTLSAPARQRRCPVRSAS